MTEPSHEPEIAMARFEVDTTLGDPGYGRRYMGVAFEQLRANVIRDADRI